MSAPRSEFLVPALSRSRSSSTCSQSNSACRHAGGHGHRLVDVDAGHAAVEAPMTEAPVVEQPVMAEADSAPFAADDAEEEDTLSYFDRLAQQG